MRSELVKYFKHGWMVELMYVSKTGEISKRKVKVLKFQGDLFQAYCFKQHARRTFLIDNVLAVSPVFPKERGAV
ncbi:transcriptional regulator [Psychrobacillus sp. NPDC096623]|uniref:transcriptional regulator n=1 Tax=Psychrobacillus sp. NPDC096623 TaxID=3364492 RepID=UPI00382499AB